MMIIQVLFYAFIMSRYELILVIKNFDARHLCKDT